jgi:DNA-binding NarL/FixJ family response regulator
MNIEVPILGGIMATKLALQKFSHLKVIGITGYYNNTYLVELIGAGFKACIFKQNIFDMLDIAIKEVYKGGLYYPDNIQITRD